MPGSTRSFLLLACSLAALALTDAKLTTGSSKSGISLANNADIQALETPISSSSSSLAKVVAAAAATVSSSSSIDMKATLSLVGMFVTWYAFNAGYNVYNAFMKRDFAFPYSTAAAQLLVGLFYAIPLWLLKLRKAPTMNKEDVIALLPIAFLNALGHTSTVVATFEKGGGSFTHVIKAAEPVVSVLLGFLVNGIVPKPFTFTSLLPITYGVAYASTLGNLSPKTMSSELTTKAAKMAMTSNFAFAMRSILRKNLAPEFKLRTNLDPANEFAVTTMISFLMVLPFAFAFEGPTALSNAFNALSDKKTFLLNSFLAGMTFYLYNEMQNKVLGSLGPVPTAVGNTLKRVVIFAALYFFTAGETFPLPKVVGCAIAIAGCLAFAICDSKKI